MRNYILLFLSGILVELIWYLAIIAVEKRWIGVCLGLAFVFPFVQTYTTCITAVDKLLWKERLFGTFWLALGGAVGMTISFWLANRFGGYLP